MVERAGSIARALMTKPERTATSRLGDILDEGYRIDRVLGGIDWSLEFPDPFKLLVVRPDDFFGSFLPRTSHNFLLRARPVG